LYFCGVLVYTLSLCSYVLFHVRSLKGQLKTENAKAEGPSVDVLTRRLANLRQLHLFTLYLFGFCFTFNVPNAFVTLGRSKTLPVAQYIQGLTFLFYFDTPIFMGFLLLHSLQWAASVRLDYFVRRRS